MLEANFWQNKKITKRIKEKVIRINIFYKSSLKILKI